MYIYILCITPDVDPPLTFPCSSCPTASSGDVLFREPAPNLIPKKQATFGEKSTFKDPLSLKKHFSVCSSSCPSSTASSGDVLSREPAAILRAAARGGSQPSILDPQPSTLNP